MSGDRIEPAVGYRFDVRVDDVDLGFFTKVDGLSAKYETRQVKEGGENGFVHVLRGRLEYTNIKLTRPVDSSSGRIAQWFASAGPQRSTASVAAFDGGGREVARWEFVGVYPVSYTGPSFTTGSSNVLTETIELAHNGFGSGGAAGSSGGSSAVAAGPALGF